MADRVGEQVGLFSGNGDRHLAILAFRGGNHHTKASCASFFNAKKYCPCCSGELKSAFIAHGYMDA